MRDKIEVNSVASIEEVIALLQGMVEGLKANRLLFERGNDFIVLFPADPVEFKFRMKVKGETAKCEMKLCWPFTMPEHDECRLRISDGRTLADDCSKV